nr:hypothetical protein [uncultured bacterium]
MPGPLVKNLCLFYPKRGGNQSGIIAGVKGKQEAKHNRKKGKDGPNIFFPGSSFHGSEIN